MEINGESLPIGHTSFYDVPDVLGDREFRAPSNLSCDWLQANRVQSSPIYGILGRPRVRRYRENF